MSSFPHSKIKLLILDLNGLFCYKLIKVINEVPVPPELIAEAKKKLEHLKCSVGEYYDIYFHPGAKDFIKWCLNNFEVGLYSSTTWYNVNIILKGVVTKKERGKLKFIWCRDRCLLHPKYGTDGKVKKYDTIKDLSLIVKNPVLNYKREYTMENILAIDDSLEKMIYNPEGSYIIIEAYDPIKKTGINRKEILDTLRKRTLNETNVNKKETNVNDITAKRETGKRYQSSPPLRSVKDYFSPDLKLVAEEKNILKNNTQLVLKNEGKGVNFVEAYMACYYLSLVYGGTDEDLVYPILSGCLQDFPSTTMSGSKIDFCLCQLKDIYSYYLKINDLNISSLYLKING